MYPITSNGEIYFYSPYKVMELDDTQQVVEEPDTEQT